MWYDESMTRRAWLVGLLIVGVIVGTLAGCSSSSRPDATSTSGSSPAATSITRAAPSSADELAALLIADVPSGFVVQPDTVGDTGPSTLAKAAKDDGDPDASQRLTEEGFIRGYQRLWQDSGHHRIVVFLYQFASATGAGQDYDRSHPKLQATAPKDAVTFALAGLQADKSGGLMGTTASNGIAVADFTADVYNVRIEVSGTNLEQLQQRVTQLAAEQLERLRH